jgi:tetraacyldisaccharide 4'-kinase
MVSGWIPWVSQRAGLVSGIANPTAFRRTVEAMQIDVAGERVYPDHHPFTRSDVDALHRWAAGSGGDVILTTQKDLVKLRLLHLGDKSLFALRIGIRFLDSEAIVRDALRRAVGEVAVPA